METKIAKESKLTYSLVTQYIDIFIKKDIVKKEKYGRCAYITLTDKGRDLQNYIMQILNLLKGDIL